MKRLNEKKEDEMAAIIMSCGGGKTLVKNFNLYDIPGEMYKLAVDAIEKRLSLNVSFDPCIKYIPCKHRKLNKKRPRSISTSRPKI